MTRRPAVEQPAVHREPRGPAYLGFKTTCITNPIERMPKLNFKVGQLGRIAKSFLAAISAQRGP